MARILDARFAEIVPSPALAAILPVHHPSDLRRFLRECGVLVKRAPVVGCGLHGDHPVKGCGRCFLWRRRAKRGAAPLNARILRAAIVAWNDLVLAANAQEEGFGLGWSVRRSEPKSRPKPRSRTKTRSRTKPKGRSEEWARTRFDDLLHPHGYELALLHRGRQWSWVLRPIEPIASATPEGQAVASALGETALTIVRRWFDGKRAYPLFVEWCINGKDCVGGPDRGLPVAVLSAQQGSRGQTARACPACREERHSLRFRHRERVGYQDPDNPEGKRISEMEYRERLLRRHIDEDAIEKAPLLAGI